MQGTALLIFAAKKLITTRTATAALTVAMISQRVDESFRSQTGQLFNIKLAPLQTGGSAGDRSVKVRYAANFERRWLRARCHVPSLVELVPVEIPVGRAAIGGFSAR